MDLAIQGLMIVAVFAVAHERLIELVRWLAERTIPSSTGRNIVGALTSGPVAAVFGSTLAYTTNANLLDAFRFELVDGVEQARFFTHYLEGPPTTPTGVLGCALMGLTVTFGSAFWHDLAKGLIELRGKLRDGKTPPEELLGRAPLRAPSASATQPRLST